MNERYQGKPLLRLAELYVLHSIGHLSARDAINLEKLAPKLSKTYGVLGVWHEIIAKVMEFPEDMPRLIIKMWEKNRDLSQQNGEILQPEDFAVMFVEANIPQD